MGQVEKRAQEQKASRRDKAKQARGRRAAAAGAVSARNLDWIALAALITVFAEANGAVRFGFTRDGGAYAMGCYLGDDYATEYVRPSEDFRGACEEIAIAWLEDGMVSYAEAVAALTPPPTR